MEGHELGEEALGYHYYNPREDGTLNYGGSNEVKHYVGSCQIKMYKHVNSW